MSKKVLICVCNSQDMMPSEFVWSIFTMHMPGKVTIARFTHPWDVVRNNVAIQAFLDGDFDILAKMDVDQRFPADYLDILVPLVEEYKVIGPVIYDRWRHSGFAPLAFKGIPVGGLAEPEPLPDDGSVVEVPYPHTNMLYAREVIECLHRPWYERYVSDDGLDCGNHMDYTFLDKIKDAGYPLYIHTGVVVNHLTLQPVDREFYDTWTRGINKGG